MSKKDELRKFNKENFDKVEKYKGFTIAVTWGVPSTRAFENGIPREVYIYDADNNLVVSETICPKFKYKTIKSAKNKIYLILKHKGE